ncbi:TaqI-like C-terminal specificity domain-containing protein [Porphyromonas gulae]|uniref:TaqI-like C-terminal specificity domain-containing protein n=1 Tax=Porphyromonas gulae TaxID=111105 RepID=UPI0026EF635B|nr:TaqI-like C-terminal specificity domain-containing protein [Porphyromonas gulae]
MANAYTPDALRILFQSSFNLEQWYSFLQGFFHVSELKEKPERIIGDSADEGYYLGSIDTTDSYRIGLFHYKIKKGSVVNKRVGLRNLVKSFINPTWGEFDAALVVFDDGNHWRLSFISDLKGDSTAPKRYTFVFGEAANCYNTAVSRFVKLQGAGVSFSTIKEAFSVEALNKEFFDKYREHYADFVQYITGKRYVKQGGKWIEKLISEPHVQLMAQFIGDEKRVRDYIKKLLGRIVFLHYLQRKGWLGVPDGKNWGEGDTGFMQHLLEFATPEQKESYELKVSSILEREDCKVIAASAVQLSLWQKLETTIKFDNIFQVWRGEELGRKSPILNSDELDSYLPILAGEDVHRYQISVPTRWIDRKLVKKSLISYSKKKILIRQLGNRINATIDLNGSIVLQSVYCLTLRTEGVDDIWFYLGLCNSKLYDYIYQITTRDKQSFQRILIENIRTLPIPSVIDPEISQKISMFAKQILQNPKELSNSQQLDQLVYELYALTDEEIRLLENDE